MAVKQELEISINAHGDVSINVTGTKGKKCLDLTRDLEEVLGIVSERSYKPQFYEQDSTSSIYTNAERKI